jgi:hypothetical protein
VSRLDYSALNDELAKRVPELAQGVARIRQQWDDSEPGPHVVYGDLLVPYLERAARAPTHPPGLVAAFDLLEEMITSFHDDEIKNVAGASVLEPLSGDRQAWSALRPFMGPYTSTLADQMEKR